MLKIRRPLGRLIFNMGIAIPGKTLFLIETAPWCQNLGEFQNASFRGSSIIQSRSGYKGLGLLRTRAINQPSTVKHLRQFRSIIAKYVQHTKTHTDESVVGETTNGQLFCLALLCIDFSTSVILCPAVLYVNSIHIFWVDFDALAQGNAY